jgi:hypothetical protein
VKALLTLQDHWNRNTDRTTVYIAAIVLDPSQKWEYFNHWPTNWVNDANEALQKLWKSTYQTSAAPE